MGSLNISTLPWTHPTIFSRYGYMGPLLFYITVNHTVRHLTYIGSKSYWQVVCISFCVADPHHVEANLGLFFTLMRIQIRILRFTLIGIWIQLFMLIRIRILILLLIVVLWICNHWSTDSLRLHCECVQGPHGSIVSLHSSWILTLMRIKIRIRILFRPDPFFQLIRIRIHVDPDPDLQRWWIQC